MRHASATLPSVTTSGSRLAACAAVWCGVHCALTPLLVVVMPALALSEGIERGVFAATLVVGTVTLALGPGLRSGSISLTFLAGAIIWATSLAGWLEPLPEELTSPAGSLLLAVSLLRSARACRTKACAVCSDAERGTGWGH